MYSFRKDVGEILDFYMRSFEVVLWSSCNWRKMKAMLQALTNVCSRKNMEGVHKCQMFDQDWCNRICNLSGVPILEDPHFSIKPLKTLFWHPTSLKGTGASSNNTLFIDNSPYKNLKNNIWNGVHLSSSHSVNKLQGTLWFCH